VLRVLVGILDAQDELAAVLAGEAEVEQRDVGGADVRITGRRRSDTGTNLHLPVQPSLRMRSEALITSVMRMPNLSLTTTTSP
jgi:hypothetical protein